MNLILDSYVNEVKKWNTVMKLARMGFPVKEKLSKYVDAKAEDIYNELEALLNHTFINVESDVETYNACDGLFDLIDELNAGGQVGMPLKNCEILNREIGGINFNGNIYGLGANSGVGKSTTAINYLMPSVLEHNEKMVIMINEEDQNKVKKELLIWVANNIYGAELHKYVLRDGHFSKEVLSKLYEAAEYLENPYKPVKGHTEENIKENTKMIDEIQRAVIQDTELTAMYEAKLDTECCPDKSYRMIAADVLYYIAGRLSRKEKQAQGKWIGTDYNPGISAEKWEELFENEKIF